MSVNKVSDTPSAFSFHPAERLHTFLEPTVWHRITPLAQKHQAINLGQGFPGFSPPDFVKKALMDTAEEKGVSYMVNQYARSAGDVSLVTTLAQEYSVRLNRQIDPLTEVVVCNGATGVIFNITQSFLNAGDEVVVFEPAFDIYAAQAAMAGALVKYVPLRMQPKNENTDEVEWSFDQAEFAAAFSAKTRMLILNTPHNPTGKVFTRAELLSIAATVSLHPNVVVVADEVYQHIIYDHAPHVHIASFTAADLAEFHASTNSHSSVSELKPLYDRTLTVCSSGKTLACTGWKVGWAVGPKHLVDCVALANSWVTFSVCTPAQVAVGRCLREASQSNYYSTLVDSYAHRRSLLTSLLSSLGLPYATPQGSFFVVADVKNVKIPEEYLDRHDGSTDWAFCEWLIETGGVASIPCSVFYSDVNKVLGSTLVRFAFAQSDKVMEQAIDRLRLALQGRC